MREQTDRAVWTVLPSQTIQLLPMHLHIVLLGRTFRHNHGTLDKGQLKIMETSR